MPPHEQPPTFVTQLKRMIEERPEIIRWSRGDIMIPDPAALERNLLKYYKHSKYASFQRQLNNFGYRRKWLGRGSMMKDTVYERQGASENLDDLLSLRPVKKKKRDAAARAARASAGRERVRAARASAALLALGASSRLDAEGTLVSFNIKDGEMKSMVLSYNNVTFNLGIGFKHKEKQNYLNYFKVGDLIKFSYMSLGAHGRPRHARFE